ncbi:hypothetical protein HA052_09035 [Chromobacterium haemolyticum]|uniref:Uncharacterized protein n=1 Tax=Chromobacterium fluminis TaxID=3044269 RepID=A0ABX0L6Z1_9NEIS|nr:hypothetical protein [Chromobacterium haemolyticum]
MFDESKIIHSPLKGEDIEFHWADLSEVSIETTDQGPFVDDVFWVLAGGGRFCRISSNAEGMEELLEKLGELPEFDHQMAIVAMSVATNARFECWKKQGLVPVEA